jgi:hypothetical protein
VNVVTARLGRDTLKVEVTLQACVPVKMPVSEELPIYGLSTGDDFVDIADVFLDAAQGVS